MNVHPTSLGCSKLIRYICLVTNPSYSEAFGEKQNREALGTESGEYLIGLDQDVRILRWTQFQGSILHLDYMKIYSAMLASNQLLGWTYPLVAKIEFSNRQSLLPVALSWKILNRVPCVQGHHISYQVWCLVMPPESSPACQVLPGSQKWILADSENAKQTPIFNNLLQYIETSISLEESVGSHTFNEQHKMASWCSHRFFNNESPPPTEDSDPSNSAPK